MLVWVRVMLIVPKCNNGSLIHCYVWVRQMPLVTKLHVYQNVVIETKFLKLWLHTWATRNPRCHNIHDFFNDCLLTSEDTFMFLTPYLPRFFSSTILHVCKLVLLTFYGPQDNWYLYRCKCIPGKKNTSWVYKLLV